MYGRDQGFIISLQSKAFHSGPSNHWDTKVAICKLMYFATLGPYSLTVNEQELIRPSSQASSHVARIII